MDADAFLDELEQRPPQVEQMSFEQLVEHDEELLPAPDAPKTEAQDESAEPAAPVTGRHQDVRLFLTVLLKTFVEMTDAGLVRDAPFRIHFDDGPVIEPDIVFVSHANFDRVHETYIEGSPDIIIEVLSHESTAIDRGDKFVLYEAQGVREYWLVDPLRELVEFYTLGPDGWYDQFRPDTAGRLRSRALKGFVLDVSRLWRRVLPTTVEIVEMAQAMLERR